MVVPPRSLSVPSQLVLSQSVPPLSVPPLSVPPVSVPPLLVLLVGGVPITGGTASQVMFSLGFKTIRIQVNHKTIYK